MAKNMSPADETTLVREPASALRGLTEQEALARRARGQGNIVSTPTSRSYWQIVRENVFTFINICLFGLGLALALLGRYGDALVSTAVISLNVLVSVVQEVRAKRTLDRIALLTRPTATLIREGRERTVPPEEIVVGDILKVGPGDQIVVDGRVIGDGGMTVDESLLTGEADLIPKRDGDPLYSGTFCVTGTAHFVAEQVGAHSLAHQITASARGFRRVLTPLQREIHLVIRIALLIVLYFEFLLTLIAVVRRITLAESIENSTIIAGLVPNGLFLSIAVAYALGALRILRFGALVQQSNAIESLSHVDVLCLDKTGTLTANRLHVSGVYALNTTDADLTAALGATAASASSGNKTTEAIATAWPARKRPLVAEVPFSSARKWSAVAFDNDAKDDERSLRGIYALGAPEMLRPYLGAVGAQESAQWRTIAAKARELADQGLRVLLVAYHPDPTQLEDKGDASSLPQDMQPLGLVSLNDVLRPEARETLAAFIEAGVQPKIISGDAPETVAALAKQAGLGSDIQLIAGPELEQMDEAQLAAAAESATIFGRVTPRQKERLVRALQQRGHYVAMIGDGVNDVPSLKQAHLGIAMQSGSQATRGVADVVLMRDSFSVLVPAVSEGQRILNGMQNILKLFLTRISTVGLVIISSLVVGTFPLELRQGSLVTLCSVGIPAVMLAFWAPVGPPPHSGLVRQLLHFILPPVLFTSVLGLLLFMSTYVLELAEAGALSSGDRLAVTVPTALPIAETALTAFLVVCGLLLVIFAQPPTRWWVGGSPLSGDWRPTLLAISLLAAVSLLSLTPGFRQLFALSPLGLRELGMVLGAVVAWLLLVRWVWRFHLLSRYLGVNLE
jgi:cation-transporting ATPase E